MASVTVIEAASSSTTIKYTLKSLHFKSNSKLNTTSILPHFIITSSSKHKSLQLLFRSKLTPHFQPLVTSSSKRDDDVIYSHSFGAKTINRLHFRSKIASSSSKSDIIESLGEGEVDGEVEGVEVEIEKVSRNRRRIRSKVAIDATLETVWGILTDYERLADYIPGLVVSQVLDKQTNFARLLQLKDFPNIGVTDWQQNLAFGLKVIANGVVDCYEKILKTWSIEAVFCHLRVLIFFDSTDDTLEQSQRYRTTLSYTVDVVPKIWLPVQLVEGRLFKEIKMNLFSIREAAQKISDTISAEWEPLSAHVPTLPGANPSSTLHDAAPAFYPPLGGLNVAGRTHHTTPPLLKRPNISQAMKKAINSESLHIIKPKQEIILIITQISAKFHPTDL
ncbi:START-like domain-containing protein [Tanacetum coccineum]